MKIFTGKEDYLEVRKDCLENLRNVISGLEDVIKKVEAGKQLENEDWIPIAVEFNEIMNPLSNSWYLPEDER